MSSSPVPNSNSKPTPIPAPKKKPGRSPKIPVVGEPAAKKPAAKKPAAKKPATKKPTAKSPTVEEPTSEETIAKTPAVKKPAAKKPSAKIPGPGNSPAENNKVLTVTAPKRGPGRPRKIVPKDSKGTDSGDKGETRGAENGGQLVEGEEANKVDGEETGEVDGGKADNADGEKAGEMVIEREANETGEAKAEAEVEVEGGRKAVDLHKTSSESSPAAKLKKVGLFLKRKRTRKSSRMLMIWLLPGDN